VRRSTILRARNHQRSSDACCRENACVLPRAVNVDNAQSRTTVLAPSFGVADGAAATLKLDYQEFSPPARTRRCSHKPFIELVGPAANDRGERQSGSHHGHSPKSTRPETRASRVLIRFARVQPW